MAQQKTGCGHRVCMEHHGHQHANLSGYPHKAVDAALSFWSQVQPCQRKSSPWTFRVPCRSQQPTLKVTRLDQCSKGMECSEAGGSLTVLLMFCLGPPGPFAAFRALETSNSQELPRVLMSEKNFEIWIEAPCERPLLLRCRRFLLAEIKIHVHA